MFPVPEILSKFTKSKSNCEDSTQKIPQRSEKTLLSKLRKKEKNRSEKKQKHRWRGRVESRIRCYDSFCAKWHWQC